MRLSSQAAISCFAGEKVLGQQSCWAAQLWAQLLTGHRLLFDCRRLAEHSTTAADQE